MMYRLAVVLIFAFLSACASTKINQESKPQLAPQVVTNTKPMVDKPLVSTTTIEKNEMGINPLKDPENILSKRSIYFDFDQYSIKSEFDSLVFAHAKYLVDHPQLNVRLEGNADDRGSREYNLALGQKRASALKRLMNTYGVSDKQIETISYGAEKPKAQGEDEASWSQNRRTDIVYSDE